MKAKRIAGPAGALHVDDGGSSGLPVMFVHSFAGSSAHWQDQLAHLRSARRAIAIDLRGHGRSQTPSTGDFTIPALATDIAAVADELGLQRFVLVGHSLGGSAAIHYAAMHPDRVAGLVLAGAPGRIPAEQANRIEAAIEADYDKVMGEYWNKLLIDATPHARQEIMRDMNRIPHAVALGVIKATMQYDPLPDLRSYTGARLVLSTAQGNTTNDLQNLLPELPHERITGTSHWLHMDRPREFNRLLDAFLVQVEQTGVRM